MPSYACFRTPSIDRLFGFVLGISAQVLQYTHVLSRSPRLVDDTHAATRSGMSSVSGGWTPCKLDVLTWSLCSESHDLTSCPLAFERALEDHFPSLPSGTSGVWEDDWTTRRLELSSRTGLCQPGPGRGISLTNLSCYSHLAFALLRRTNPATWLAAQDVPLDRDTFMISRVMRR